jgi:polysaccharide biosynthesis protein PslH
LRVKVIVRILMISPTYPLPTDTGAKRRVLAFAHQLGQRHDLTLATLREPAVTAIGGDNGYVVPWQEHIVDLPGVSRKRTALRAFFSSRTYREVKFKSRKLQFVIATLLKDRRFDVIWVNFLNMAPYLQPRFKQRQSPRLLVLDQHNVDEHVRRSLFSSSTSISTRMYAALEMAKAQRLQQRWYPRFDAILSVAPEDLNLTSQYVNPGANLWLAPNGVDVNYFRPVLPPSQPAGRPRLVFGGSMDVIMNQDAVRWFVENVLSLIRQQVPEAEFCIVGRNPPASIRHLADRPGIRVTGSVLDVREHYGQADVFVVPARFGGGTKLKTLEAMAMSLPVVSTTVGAQGLRVRSGRHLYVADRPEDFAARVVELLAVHRKAREMGREARRLVEKHYSWTSIVGQIEHKLTALLAQPE